MDMKNYKKIDWSKRKSIEECVSFGDTNGNVFAATLNDDGEWVPDPDFQKANEE